MSTPYDLVELLRTIDPDVMVLRLEQLEADARSLRGLLRLTRAGQRAQARARHANAEGRREVSHARW
jgi:hypothetical protein